MRFVVMLADREGMTLRESVTIPARSLSFEADLARLSRERASATSRATMVRVGRRMFRSLFPRALADQFQRSRESARAAGVPLRIALRIDLETCAELLDLPWELLHDGRGHCLADPDIELLRVRDLRTGGDAPPLPETVRVVVAVSSPIDLPDALALSTERELSGLLSTIGTGGKELRIDVLPVASLAEIEARLTAQPCDIFHFIGHGRFDPVTAENYVLLETPDGRSDPVSAAALTSVLAKAMPRIVIVNACETAASMPSQPGTSLAWRLASAGCPAVVAMRAAVPDEIAITFSVALYHELRAGSALAAAVSSARRAVATSSNGVTPILGVPILMQQSDGEIRIQAAGGQAPAALPTSRREVRETDLDRILRRIRVGRPAAVWLRGPRGVGATTLTRLATRRLHERGIVVNDVPLVWPDARTAHEDAPVAAHLVVRTMTAAGDVIAFSRELPEGSVLFVEGPLAPPYPAELAIHDLRELTAGETAQALGTLLQAPAEVLNAAFRLGAGNVVLTARLLGAPAPIDETMPAIMRDYLREVVDFSGADPAEIRLAAWLGFLMAPADVRALAEFAPRVIGPVADANQAIERLLARGVAVTRPGGRIGVPAWLRPRLAGIVRPEARLAVHEACGDFLASQDRDDPAVQLEAAAHYDAASLSERATDVRLVTITPLQRINEPAAVSLARQVIASLEARTVGVAQQLLLAQAYTILGVVGANLLAREELREAHDRCIAIAESALAGTGLPEAVERQFRLILADAWCASAEAGLLEFPEASERLRKAEEVFRLLGDSEVLRSRARRAVAALRANELDEFRQLAAEASALAESSDDVAAVVDVVGMIGAALASRHPPPESPVPWLERALAAAREAMLPQRASLALALASCLEGKDDHAARAAALLREAETLFQRRGDQSGVAATKLQWGRLAASHADIPEAAVAHYEAMTIYEALGDPRAAEVKELLSALIERLLSIGDQFLTEGRYELADRYFDAARLLRPIDGSKYAYTLWRRGITASERGDLVRANEWLVEAREEALLSGEARVAAECLHELGCVAFARDDMDAAAEWLLLAENEKRDMDLSTRNTTRHVRALVLRKKGEAEQARALLEECVRSEAKEDARSGWATSALQLSNLLVCEFTEPDRAEELAHEVRVIARALHSESLLAMCDLALGNVELARGNEPRARELYYEALHRARELDIPLVSEIESTLAELERPSAG